MYCMEREWARGTVLLDGTTGLFFYECDCMSDTNSFSLLLLLLLLFFPFLSVCLYYCCVRVYVSALNRLLWLSHTRVHVSVCAFMCGSTIYMYYIFLLFLLLMREHSHAKEWNLTEIAFEIYNVKKYWVVERKSNRERKRRRVRPRLGVCMVYVDGIGLYVLRMRYDSTLHTLTHTPI